MSQDLLERAADVAVEMIRLELVKVMPFGTASLAVETIDRIRKEVVSGAAKIVTINSGGVLVEDKRTT